MDDALAGGVRDDAGLAYGCFMRNDLGDQGPSIQNVLDRLKGEWLVYLRVEGRDARWRKVRVWGCGNFECWWPAQLFGTRAAERRGTVEVHPWADVRPPRDQKRRGAILRTTWRERFGEFGRALDRVAV